MVKNLLNDFVFKYVFGEDTKDSNEVLKLLLEAYLKETVRELKIKNPALTKNVESMKDPVLDIFVEFNNSVQVDIEMQVCVNTEELEKRISYYLARIHGSQSIKGKSYLDLKQSIVLLFLNGKIYKHLDFCQEGCIYTRHGELMSDSMKIIVVELNKLDQQKEFEDMSEQERIAYYIMNCQDRKINSKIKTMIEQDKVIQMINERVDQIEEERWKKLISDFEEFHENERQMLSRNVEKKIKDAHDSGKMEGKAEGVAEIIHAFSKTMSVEQIASALGKSVNEIEEILKNEL